MSETGSHHIASLAEKYELPTAQSDLLLGQPVAFAQGLVIPFRNAPPTAAALFNEGLNTALEPAFLLQRHIIERNESAPETEVERDRQFDVMVRHLKPPRAVTGQVKDFHIELLGQEEMPLPERHGNYRLVEDDIIRDTELRFIVTAHIKNLGSIACGLGIDVRWRQNEGRSLDELYTKNQLIPLPHTVRKVADLAKLNRGLAQLREATETAKQPHGGFGTGKNR